MVDAQTHMKTAQILGHLTTPDSVVKTFTTAHCQLQNL